MDIQSLELEIDLLHERICSALGDPTRIMMLYLLSEKGLFVNEISEALGTPQSSVSRHLRILRERSLVTAERQGTAVLYSLSDRRIIQALDLMRAMLSAQVQAQARITASQPITTTSHTRS
jgi:DNA-binding transcriptional ArsR family regulator